MLGFEYNGGDIRCACPIHDGDNDYAFHYSVDTKRWNCYTNHCQKEYFGDLLGLIKAVKFKDLDPKNRTKAALAFAEDLLKQNFDKISIEDAQRRKFIRTKKGGTAIQNDFKIFHPSLVANLDHKVQLFLEYGISQEVLNQYNAFYCGDSNKRLFGRACLPIYNQHGQMVGFSGKKTHVLPNDAEKWLHAPASIQTRYYLYNMHKLVKGDSIILVEGPVDSLKLITHGVTQVASIFGSQIKKEQIEFLFHFGFKNVICAYDRDGGGEKALISTEENCSRYFNLYNADYLFDGDPGKSSSETILRAKEILMRNFDVCR